jgi:hypothetical protein
MREANFSETYETCKKFGFSDEATALHCWNAGYTLGRKRWHWGPQWLSAVKGWINTQKYKLSKFFNQ